MLGSLSRDLTLLSEFLDTKFIINNYGTSTAPKITSEYPAVQKSVKLEKPES
jgi:hypothetical protein